MIRLNLKTDFELYGILAISALFILLVISAVYAIVLKRKLRGLTKEEVLEILEDFPEHFKLPADSYTIGTQFFN